MKQIVQDLKSGKTELIEIPPPSNIPGNLLIRSSCSVVSSGTERMLINFGKAGYLNKARQQPEKVKEVFQKFKTDGILNTFDAVNSKLNQPLPLGYCNSGVVINTMSSDFKVGDRVISNGPHSEIVRAPKNLCCKIPNEVDDETASFTVLASIALQGIRLIKPDIGDTVVVSGLGIIGLLAVQILIANGCRVIAIDFDQAKCDLAKKFGANSINLMNANNPVDIVNNYSEGLGVDAVLITASTESSEPIKFATNILRKRGKIVLVGVVGMQLNRSDFYEKEISFQVSCSYGPGRYDKNYEEEGYDYPIGYVKWTENRNFKAILKLMAAGKIVTEELITHKVNFENAIDAYKYLENNNTLGIVLNYKNQNPIQSSVEYIRKDLNNKNELHHGNIDISFIGGGNYASRTLIPAFKKNNSQLHTIVTSMGINSGLNAKKFNFIKASTNINDAFDEEVDAVVIATQHNLHAEQTIQALNKGKNVFVEKPLALNNDQLESVYKAQKKANKILMVGFNRRFAPHIIKIKDLIDLETSPKTFIMTMNAGHIPKDHWTQDKKIGGGRIIGEACHYIDLMRYLAGSKINKFNAMKMTSSNSNEINDDKSIITLSFEDGSVGTIQYFANGGKLFPKERIEVFCNNAVLQLDNFKRLRGYGWKGFNKMNLWNQDKGQNECVRSFISSIKENSSGPIPIEEIYEVSKITIDIANSLK